MYNKTEGVTGTSIMFSTTLHHFTSLTLYVSFQFLHIPRVAAFWLFITAQIAGSQWNLTLVLACISLMNNKGWAINRIPAEDLCVLFWEMPIQIFFFHFTWLILVTYEDFFYIYIYFRYFSLIKCIIYKYFLLVFHKLPFYLLGVSFAVQKLFSLME